jgi:flagellar L-ring protein precursor FlgH
MIIRTTAHAPIALIAIALILAPTAWRGAARADSIWGGAASQPSSLFSTTKGEYKLGDILTIIIVESFKASSRASTETDKERDLEMQFEGFDDIFGITHIFGKPISANPNFAINAESEFDGGGSSQRSSTLTGTVTGQITEILSTGNLRIEASQTTVINGEKNSVILLGTIRPQDISAQNTIFSTQISNAEIRYEGVGPLSTVQKRGVITEFLEFIWPF